MHYKAGCADLMHAKDFTSHNAGAFQRHVPREDQVCLLEATLRHSEHADAVSPTHQHASHQQVL